MKRLITYLILITVLILFWIAIYDMIKKKSDSNPKQPMALADSVIIYADTIYVLNPDTIHLEGGFIVVDPRAYTTMVDGVWLDGNIKEGIYHGYFYWYDSTGSCDSIFDEPFCWGYKTRYRLNVTMEDSLTVANWSGGVLSMFLMTGANLQPSYIREGFGVITIKTDGVDIIDR